MITVWSGREAHALRAAMRLSIYDFAAHAGVSPRSVAKWSARGAELTLRWDMQRRLDRVLAKAGPEVQERFEDLLRSPAAGLTRRELLPAAGVVGIGAPELIATLINPPEPTGRFVPPALIHLERAIARVRIGYQACRHRDALYELPGLLRLLVEAQGAPTVAYPQRVHRLAAEAYHVTAGLMLALGDLPLAMLAAQRCVREAETSGEPLMIAAAQRATARVLIRAGQPVGAAKLVHAAAVRLSRQTGLDGPRALSGYGALLLRGVVARARAGNRGEVMAGLGEAERVAQRLGSDGNFGWTAFGPTNVVLHRVSALLMLGDPEGALEAGRSIEPEAIRQVERRAAFYRDTGVALRELGRSREAAARLRQAALLSPPVGG